MYFNNTLKSELFGGNPLENAFFIDVKIAGNVKILKPVKILNLFPAVAYIFKSKKMRYNHKVPNHLILLLHVCFRLNKLLAVYMNTFLCYCIRTKQSIQFWVTIYVGVQLTQMNIVLFCLKRLGL